MVKFGQPTKESLEINLLENRVRETQDLGTLLIKIDTLTNKIDKLELKIGEIKR